MLKTYIKHYLQWAGYIIAVSGVLFVGFRFSQVCADIDFSRLNASFWYFFLILGLIGGLANGLLVLAWQNLLANFGFIVNYKWAVRIYGMSSIGKYLPGNIFHLAGRQTLGMADNISGWALAKSTALELGLLVSAGGLFIWLVIPIWFPEIGLFSSLALWLLTLAGVFFLLKQYAGLHLTNSFTWQAIYLTVSGILFFLVLKMFVKDDFPGIVFLPTTVGIYVVSWLVGLITPGAPAGAGAREITFMFLLKDILTQEDLLIVILLSRVFTILGDLIFFAIAICIHKEKTYPYI